MVTCRPLSDSTLKHQPISNSSYCGTFQLHFSNHGLTGTTSPIYNDAEPSVFESALESMALNIIPPGTIRVHEKVQTLNLATPEQYLS
jgi:hypothetical protein